MCVNIKKKSSSNETCLKPGLIEIEKLWFGWNLNDFKCIFEPGPASSIGRASAFQSSYLSLIQHADGDFLLLRKDLYFIMCNLDFFKLLYHSEKNDTIYWNEKEVDFHSTWLLRKGYIARINWSYDKDADATLHTNKSSILRKSSSATDPLHRKSVDWSVFLQAKIRRDLHM